MANQALPCPTVLRLLLRYEPETGKLFWRARPRVFFKAGGSFKTWNGRYAGTPALSYKDNHGYLMGAVGKCRHMKAHIAAFAMTYGRYPKSHLDHINGQRDDNRICNIREATHTENQRNLKMNRRNKSGQVGVFWHVAAQKWWAYIGSGKSRKTIGYFVEKMDAINARLRAQEDQGYHPLHGLSQEERRKRAANTVFRAKRPRQ